MRLGKLGGLGSWVWGDKMSDCLIWFSEAVGCRRSWYREIRACHWAKCGSNTGIDLDQLLYGAFLHERLATMNTISRLVPIIESFPLC
ncbi:White-opaque regulator 2 [Fusarium oxysporum f. sp. albedinis]|nr:White-opaque regulator 2 [Fusarium oxysporum f. sp. albedinis]